MVPLLLRCHWGVLGCGSALSRGTVRPVAGGLETSMAGVNQHAGFENFCQYYAIPENQKIKCIQLTKCQCYLPLIPLEVMVQEVKQELPCCFSLQTIAVLGPPFGNTITALD